MATKTKRVIREINVETQSVKFTENGTDNSITVSVNDFPAEIQTRLMLHGINAKVGDTAASPDVDFTTVLTAAINALKAGEWTQRGTGEGGPRVTLLAKALMRVTGQSQDEVLNKLENPPAGRDKKEFLAELRKHPSIAEAIAAIKAEEAVAKAKTSKVKGDKPALVF